MGPKLDWFQFHFTWRRKERGEGGKSGATLSLASLSSMNNGIQTCRGSRGWNGETGIAAMRLSFYFEGCHAAASPLILVMRVGVICSGVEASVRVGHNFTTTSLRCKSIVRYWFAEVVDLQVHSVSPNKTISCKSCCKPDSESELCLAHLFNWSLM